MTAIARSKSRKKKKKKKKNKRMEGDNFLKTQSTYHSLLAERGCGSVEALRLGVSSFKVASTASIVVTILLFIFFPLQQQSLDP